MKLIASAAPAGQAWNIDRTALLSALPVDFRVAAIVAPAGYGKTVLMSQWCGLLERNGERTVWLTPDVGYRRANTKVHALEPGLRSIDNIVKLIREPVTVFIDDLHYVSGTEAGACLQYLLDTLPNGCRLVLATRTRLSLELGAMTIDGTALEISWATLAFSNAEARQYLGGGLADSECAALQNFIEGWPIALRICRDFLLERGAVSLFTATSLNERLVNSDRLRTYFDEEVLGSLPVDYRNFVIQTSILDEITAALAESVTERPDGAAILDALCRQNIFTFPIAGHPLWLRYHRLFRAYLRSNHLRSETVIADLHRKSAAWLLHHDLYAQALPHIFAVGDPEFIAQLLIASGGWCLLFRGGALAARILQSLPLALVRAQPSLELARIYRLIQTGELASARRFFEELKQRTNNFSSGPEDKQPNEADGIVMELLLSLYEDRTLGPQALIKAEAGLSADPGDDAIRSSVIRELLSWSLYHAGNFQKAIFIGQESVDLCVRAGIPYVQIYAYLAIGLSELAGGRVQHAADIYSRAETEAVSNFGDGCNQVMAAQILGAEILYARNQVSAARNCTEHWHEVVACGDGWVDLYSTLYRTLSSSLRALDDAPAAMEVLEQARHMARSRQLWRLDQILQAHQLREACLCGNTELAGRLARTLQNEHPRSVSVRHQGWRVWYSRLLALARYALDIHDVTICSELIHDIDRLVLEGSGNHSLYRLERNLLEARMLFESNGDGDAYARPLSRALVQAAAAGLIRSILDEGPTMLRMLRQYADTFTLSRTFATFINDVHSQVAQVHVPQPLTLKNEGRSAGHATVVSEILSKRESALLALIYDGLTSKEIARRLDISINTVLTHRKNLYRKLHATTRSQLITIARDQQMLKLTAGAAPYA